MDITNFMRLLKINIILFAHLKYLLVFFRIYEMLRSQKRFYK